MPDHSSSQTTEHWFLDLDGVRSGPYQTPEVLSLVAEGEVMPHHRISTGLKDQPWITILDWRFEQAKKSSHEPEVKEVRSYIPASAKPPVREPEAKIELTSAVEEWTPVEPPAAVAPTPPPIEPPPAPPQAEPTPQFTAPKRDPMAEMFDVLQTSKQKREAKSQQIAQQHSHPIEEEGESKRTSGWIKTAGIGVFITVIGFALGQIFQQSSQPPTPTAENKPAAASPAPTTKTEVIDRSTDKITIRGRVETVQKPSAAATPLPTRAPQISRPGTATAAHSEKELQELKDLKKELQELKALKDELKQAGSENGNGPEEMPENVEEFNSTGVGNAEVDQGYHYYPAMPNTTGGAVYPNNGYPQPTYPNNGQNGQPSPNTNPNVHY